MIVDAGPLYAYVDSTDRHHRTCVDLLESHPGILRVPMLVITEAAHLIRTRIGTRAEIAFLGDLASGALVAEPVEPGDWIAIAELTARYADLPLGATDASVAVTAQRLGDFEIATVDRRHFDVLAGEFPFTVVPVR